MDRPIKNLKINPDVHNKVKVMAAQRRINITDFADLIIMAMLEKTGQQAELRERLVSDFLSKAKKEQYSQDA